MRFVFGAIPASEVLGAPSASWTPLVSPAPERAMILSCAGMVPLLVLAGLALRPAADILTPTLLLSIASSPLLLVCLHELTHALAYGKDLRSRRLVSGIWLRRGIWYVVYDGPMPRNRVVFMLVAPLLFLSLLPSLALPVLPYGLRCGLLYMIYIQASLCVGDMLTAYRICRQVPVEGLIHNQGWTTYWMRPSQSDPACHSGD